MQRFDPERLSSVLEAMAHGHAPESEEFLAIELAAKAVLYVHATRQGDAFQRYVATMGNELTPEQKAFNRSIGLDD